MNKEKAIERLAAIEKETQELRKLINTPEDIKDRIKTVDDAVEYLGREDEDVTLLERMYGWQLKNSHLIAYQELVVITKALNEKEVLDWDDANSKKFFNYFNMRGNLRFNGSYYRCNHSDVPAHLCFKTRDLAEYAAKQFLSIYKNYIKPC